MNIADKRLDDTLKAARVPERSPGYWDAFPRRVAAQLEDRPQPGVASAWGWWAAGFGVVCLLVVLSFWLRPRHDSHIDYAKMYREVTTLFPNQVRAIIEDERGVHLVLADQPDVPSSPPLLVRVCQPQRCRSVITFSGQSVRLDGETIEVLADGRGQVLVIGERSIVQPTEARTL